MLRKLMILKLLKNHFKLFDAIQILIALLCKRESVIIKQFNIQLYFRKHSKDYETFEEIFLKNIYDISLPIKPLNIVDAGANTGFASLFFHMKYPESNIVALEIDENNVEMFHKNTNGISSIEIIKKALFNKKSYFKVINPYNATNSFQIVEVKKDKNFDIESITINEILEFKKWNEIDILKIDIEGAEKQLFESDYQSWLPKVKIIMIETHDRMIRNCSTVVVKSLSEFNFILYITMDGTLIFYNLTHIKI